jgi:hypothetical protein
VRQLARFGYLRAEQVMRMFGMSRIVAYRRLKALARLGFVRRVEVPGVNWGVYMVTERGLAEADAAFARARIRPATLMHHLTVAEVAIALTAATGGVWVTERELRREAGQRFGVGYLGHVPDGVLVLPDGRKVAVELENTSKTPRRLQKILRDYLRRTDYAEVWFVCRTTRQADKVRQAARGMDFVRVMRLEEDVLRPAGGGGDGAGAA